MAKKRRLYILKRTRRKEGSIIAGLASSKWKRNGTRKKDLNEKLRTESATKTLGDAGVPELRK
jgi:hypothetical protein